MWDTAVLTEPTTKTFPHFCSTGQESLWCIVWWDWRLERVSLNQISYWSILKMAVFRYKAKAVTKLTTWILVAVLQCRIVIVWIGETTIFPVSTSYPFSTNSQSGTGKHSRQSIKIHLCSTSTLILHNRFLKPHKMKQDLATKKTLTLMTTTSTTPQHWTTIALLMTMPQRPMFYHCQERNCPPKVKPRKYGKYWMKSDHCPSLSTIPKPFVIYILLNERRWGNSERTPHPKLESILKSIHYQHQQKLTQQKSIQVIVWKHQTKSMTLKKVLGVHLQVAQKQTQIQQ